MKFLSNIGTCAKNVGGVAARKISAKSPEILFALGVATFAGTMVTAVIATMKGAEEVIDKHNRRMLEIDNGLEIAKEGNVVTEETEEVPEAPSYSIEEARKDRFLAYCETFLGFGKVYGPTIVLGATSLTCFAASYGILKTRNVALSGLYYTTKKGFDEYRERVKRELGEEADQHFRYGYESLHKEKVGVVDADGNVTEETRDIDVVPWDEEERGDNTFLFAPETSTHFQMDEVHNDSTLSVSRSNMQLEFDKNGRHGVLFLNEVLRDLGLKEIKEGQYTGWAKGYGDPYIDYRVKKVYRPMPQNDPIRNPLGLKYQCVYLLDFNTCGYVLDKLPEREARAEIEG